jgi:NADH:ubiquinone oxidoreductase subunit K
VTVSLVSVLFVSIALVAVGGFAAAWRRELTASLAALPLMLGGAAVAFVGVARFSAATGPALFGQEVAALLAVSALALVALGIGIAGREGSR